MGYYCTVPQCTSLAGKTKNVKFHRFPRDVTMADKWNVILKRFKPYTKYSKVCSLHFTQADYNVTTMGQWKTLSKDAVPSQNLPKLNADGTVMVIRKSRTTKYRDSNPNPLNISKKEVINVEKDKWVMATPQHTPLPLSTTQESQTSSEVQDGNLNQRLQTLSNIASTIPHHAPLTAIFTHKPKKQDAIMQTDPVQSEEDDSQENYEGEKSAASGAEYPPKKQNDIMETNPVQSEEDAGKRTMRGKSQQEEKTGGAEYSYPKPAESFEQKKYDAPKDYTKSEEDFIPRTNEEYNNEAEKYALERKSHNGYDKQETYPKAVQMDGFQKMDMYSSFSEKNYPVSEKNYPVSEKNYPVSEKNYPVSEKSYPVSEKSYPISEKNYPNRPESWYTNGYPDSVELLRNQQHNLQMLQEQHRITENQNFFNENHIKVEIDNNEEDKFLYERTKEHLDANAIYEAGQRRLQQQRLMDHLSHQVKQEPETSQGCENVMQPQGSPYYPSNGHNAPGGYYGELSRPGPELLIAKQNALAAHTQLWQNTMKRPFFYSDSPHYNSPPLLHRYEDISRILQ